MESLSARPGSGGKRALRARRLAHGGRGPAAWPQLERAHSQP